MENDFGADRDYKLWVLMCVTRDAIFNIRKKEMRTLGISPMQVAVLYHVQASGNKVNPAELARSLFRAPHSVSSIISRMEKHGLVEKIKDLDKKNMVRIAVTEKGQKNLEQSAKKVGLQKVMSCLSGEEHQQLKSCLAKLHAEALKELSMKL